MVEDLDCFSPVIDQEEEFEEVPVTPARKQRHYKPWNQEEDDRLRVLAPQYAFDWTSLTQYFAGKSAACLRRRWDFKHNPNITARNKVPAENHAEQDDDTDDLKHSGEPL